MFFLFITVLLDTEIFMYKPGEYAITFTNLLCYIFHTSSLEQQVFSYPTTKMDTNC